jgi:spermidine synthase
MFNQLSSQFPFTIFKKRSKESLVLYIAMFVMGACGLAYEYTLSKVASDILGNSIRQWAIVIGIMMFFMGIGSDLQKYLSDRNLIDKFIFFEILLGVLGAFGPITLLFVYGTLPSHYVLTQYFFISAIGMIIGLEIPMITRINEKYTAELRVNLGGVLKMDYIGSLAGSLIWIFILPKYFMLIESAFVLGIFNILVGGIALWYFNRLVHYKFGLNAFVILSLIIVLTGYSKSHSWTSSAEQYLFRDRIVHSESTPFQHIVITESPSGVISCYINGHLQFNSVDEFIYHENLVHPAFSIASKHKRILILGGGDGLALREVLKYPEVEEVVLCDIDPHMTDLAAKNQYFLNINSNSLKNHKVMILKNNALISSGQDTLYLENQNVLHSTEILTEIQVQVINLDASKFIEQFHGFFDIIIIDFPDPSSQDLAKLYSLVFYELLKTKLSKGGIFVQQSTSPVHAKEAFLCIGRTMREAGFSVVPYHDNVPTFGEWGWWIGGKNTEYSENSLKDKLTAVKALSVPTRYLTEKLISTSLHFGIDQLYSTSTEITTIANSKVFEFYLNAWN